MSVLTGLAADERSARAVLARLSDPGDTRTGALVSAVGAVETVRLVEFERDVPALSRADALRWRDLAQSRVGSLGPRVLDSVSDVIVPGDVGWPEALSRLGRRAPLALWVSGNEAVLARPVDSWVTLTGARAATAYGEQAAGELAEGLVSERYGIVWAA